MRIRLVHSELVHRRRGVATLWLILALPLFLIILGALLEIANLWLARIELKNGLDAASLAAVKEWAESPGGTDTQPARAVGVDFATANDSGGQPIPLATNYDVGGGVNENDTNDDGLIFGAVDVSDLTDIVFDAGEAPSCTVASQDVFGVRAQSNIPVNSIFSNLLGLPLGPYSIEAKSDAIYDCNIGSPRLVHINQFLPGP
jgi:Flp pilus assembly protein TadG